MSHTSNNVFPYFASSTICSMSDKKYSFGMACFKTAKNVSLCFLLSRMGENMVCCDSQKKVALYAQKSEGSITSILNLASLQNNLFL